MNYELEAKRSKVRGEVGYGIFWLFIVALVEVICYAYEFKGIYSHIVAGLAGIAAIYKFIEGIRMTRII